MKSKPTLRSFFKKKEVEYGKETKLEKNDFLALLIAAASVFVPIILGFAIALGAFIWLFIQFGPAIALLISIIVVMVVTFSVKFVKKEEE